VRCGKYCEEELEVGYLAAQELSKEGELKIQLPFLR